MAFTAGSVDDILLPSPKRILRRGTPEFDDALKKGEIELSLPQPELNAWLGMSTDFEPSMVHSSKRHKSNISHDVSSGLEGRDQLFDQDMRHMDEERSTNDDDAVDTKCDHIGDAEQSCHTTNPAQKTHVSTPSAQKSDSKTSSIIQPSARFRDIIGHGAVKLRLDELLLPIALPTSLADSILTGIRSLSASILLHGPPGCGKTQLAKAIAGEAQAAFLSIGPSDILSKFVGESEASIRAVFDKAYEQAKEMESRCAVLFFDEIDALGQSRGESGVPSGEQKGGGDACSRRVLAELLIQLNRINIASRNGEGRPLADEPTAVDDNCDTDSVDTVYDDDMDLSSANQDDEKPANAARVIVVAATNRPEDCDPALVRRFAIRVLVGLPSRRDRKRILSRFLGDVDHNITRVQLGTLSEATEGWSGSDLESLSREAAMAPIRECIRRAALLKRRIRKREQRGGDSSCQEDQPDVDAYEQARENLLQHFKTLRPVTVEDFENAIAFWMAGTQSSSADGTGHWEIENLRRCTHYDSSSDEDE